MFIAILALVSCASKDNPEEIHDPVSSAVAFQIKVDSGIVQTGERLSLSVVEGQGDGVTPSEYQWTFSDGQKLTGKSVSAAFSAAGTVKVKLEAFAANQSLGADEAQISVVEAGALAPAAFGLPQAPGDIDGNHALELEDALLAAQATGGLIAVDADILGNADMDLDGRVNAADVALMQKAVLRGEPLPRALFNDSGRPGAVVALVSPALMTTGKTVDVKVDGRSAPQVLQAVRGYASFVVPDGVTKGSSPASVELVIGGTVTDRFQLAILDPVAMPADAKADVQHFLTELDAALVAQQDALKSQISSLSLSDSDSMALLAAGDASLKEMRRSREQFTTLLEGSDGEAMAKRLQQGLYANGLADFRNEGSKALALRAAAASSVPDPICDIVLPKLCALKSAVSKTGAASEILGGACSAVSAVALVGAARLRQPKLLALIELCVNLSVPIEIAGAISDFVDPIEPGLRLTADKTTLGQNESAIVRSEITFTGVEQLCSAGVSAGGTAILDKTIGRIVVGRVIKHNAALNVLSQIFAKFGDKKYVDFLESYVQAGVSNTLSATQISGALSDFAGKLCPDIRLGAAQAVAQNIIQQPAIDEGNLLFQADGTAKYYCAPAGPLFKSKIDLKGSKALCGGKVANAKISMTCATSPVTITMGDNGSALDDIYEVIVDGRTVLTSSGPIRSTSITLQLPRGRTTVTMRGLAAPDGIGTYFISFSGAAFVGGDPLSGSDLVPGTTKRFIIEIL
jgi:hypothetical protein